MNGRKPDAYSQWTWLPSRQLLNFTFLPLSGKSTDLAKGKRYTPSFIKYKTVGEMRKAATWSTHLLLVKCLWKYFWLFCLSVAQICWSQTAKRANGRAKEHLIERWANPTEPKRDVRAGDETETAAKRQGSKVSITACSIRIAGVNVLESWFERSVAKKGGKSML